MTVAPFFWPVEQQDRDVAADYAAGQPKFSLLWQEASAIRRGDHDDWEIVQAFARHRLAAEQPLRERVSDLELMLKVERAALAAGPAVGEDAL